MYDAGCLNGEHINEWLRLSASYDVIDLLVVLL
jgi:hypothetical protein